MNKIRVTLSLSFILMIFGVSNVSALGIPSTEISDPKKVFSHAGYDYVPTVMKDGTTYKIWWCGDSFDEVNPHDVIYYAYSSDLITWKGSYGQTNQFQPVLSTWRPPQGRHACDPSVVKKNGVYYMYYTSELDYGGIGGDNQIYLATSTNGINWTPANNKNAVIRLPSDYVQGIGEYGIGQSTVIFKDNVFLHSYIYSTSNGNGGRYLTTSTNGINFVNPLKIYAGTDIKYMPGRNQFIAVDGGPSMLVLYSDNFTRLAVRSLPMANVLQRVNITNYCLHSSALLGDSRGYLLNEDQVTIFFTIGDKDVNTGNCRIPSTWEIYRVNVNLASMFPATPTPTATESPTASPTPEIAKPGDANDDGLVDEADYQIWNANYGKSLSGPNNADFNNDNKVDGIDYTIWLLNLGK